MTWREEIIKKNVKFNIEADSLSIREKYYSEEIIYRWNQILDLLDEIDVLQNEYLEGV